MNTRKLVWMVVAVLLLGGVFYLANNGGETKQEQRLLADIDSDRVNAIVVKRGESEATVKNINGRWALPARWDYAADAGKASSLLLKLFDLTVTQHVTDNPENFGPLGVNDEAVAKSATKISLQDNEGKDLVQVYLGENRKSGQAMLSSGQYVRRANANDVYLIKDSLSASATVTEWLNTELPNVPKAKVRAVSQYTSVGGKETLAFRLEQKAEAGESFQLADAPSAELQDAVVSQVVSGLENGRLTDVLKAAEAGEKLKEIAFDSRTVFEGSNALIYTVTSSGEKDGKSYLRLAVSYDSALAQRIEAEIARKNEELQKKQSEQSSSAAVEQGASSSVSSVQLLKAELARPEDAAKQQADLEPWVFEVAKYQVERFRKTRPELLKPAGTPSPAN